MTGGGLILGILQPEVSDASGVICHDCKRGLIRDPGGIFVCPKLHGRRPGEMTPSNGTGAVECGQAGI